MSDELVLHEDDNYIISMTVEGFGRRANNTFVVTGALLYGAINPRGILGMELHERAVQTAEGWLADVYSRPFPQPDHIARLSPKVKKKFRARLKEWILAFPYRYMR